MRILIITMLGLISCATCIAGITTQATGGRTSAFAQKRMVVDAVVTSLSQGIRKSANGGPVAVFELTFTITASDPVCVPGLAPIGLTVDDAPMLLTRSMVTVCQERPARTIPASVPYELTYIIHLPMTGNHVPAVRVQRLAFSDKAGNVHETTIR